MATWLSDLAARLMLRASTAGAAIEPATLRDAPVLSTLHRASFHRGWGVSEFEQMLTERNTLAHRLRLGGQTAGFIVSRIAAASIPNARAQPAAAPIVPQVPCGCMLPRRLAAAPSREPTSYPTTNPARKAPGPRPFSSHSASTAGST